MLVVLREGDHTTRRPVGVFPTTHKAEASFPSAAADHIDVCCTPLQPAAGRWCFDCRRGLGMQG